MGVMDRTGKEFFNKERAIKNMNYIGDITSFSIDYHSTKERDSLFKLLTEKGAENIVIKNKRCVGPDPYCIITIEADTKKMKNHFKNNQLPHFNTKQIEYISSSGTENITRYQESFTEQLKNKGTRVLKLDVSFLNVGHIDEFYSVVKTNKPAPCDYAVMIASPTKAFELLEKNSEKKNSHECMTYEDIDYKASSVKPPAPRLTSMFDDYEVEEVEDVYDILSKEDQKILSDQNCIDGESIYHYLKSDKYKIAKRKNVGPSSAPTINDIIEKNKKKLRDELKLTTGCKSPTFIDIPVFYRNGLSRTPNMVNGVVQIMDNGLTHFISPRPYLKVFEDYMEKELDKYDIETTYVHDMGYHLHYGDVHCGTNSARICRP